VVPKNDLSCLTEVGGWAFFNAAVLSLPGLIPGVDKVCPRYSVSCLKNEDFNALIEFVGCEGTAFEELA